MTGTTECACCAQGVALPEDSDRHAGAMDSENVWGDGYTSADTRLDRTPMSELGLQLDASAFGEMISPTVRLLCHAMVAAIKLRVVLFCGHEAYPCLSNRNSDCREHVNNCLCNLESVACSGTHGLRCRF